MARIMIRRVIACALAALVLLTVADAEEAPGRSATLAIDFANALGPLDIGKVASLGQGGLSEDRIWEGRAAEVRALHPRLIRLFLQEYFDVLPEKGRYDF